MNLLSVSLVTALSLYPCVVVGGINWPDNSTQYKGYVEVGLKTRPRLERVQLWLLQSCIIACNL